MYENIYILEVKDLRTSFYLPAGEVKAVDGVSFNLEKGKILGIVGESGSGKSVTAYSILQILSKPGKIIGGSVKFNGQELIGSGEVFMRKIRGNRIAIIFQDPMTSLNPVYTIGNQLIEAVRLHTPYTKEEAYNIALEMLNQVGVNDPARRMRQYPFEFSGGMLQRVMIAMALISEPDILIADEPTTALDVTIQAQILDLMKSLQKKMGMAIILITHDLGVIAEMCNEIDVMYAGRIVERGDADSIFYDSKHEYTKGLIRSIPSLDKRKEKLIPIGGAPIDLLNKPQGCPFAPRCDKTMKICLSDYPEEFMFSTTHYASCWNNVKEMVDKGEILLTGVRA